MDLKLKLAQMSWIMIEYELFYFQSLLLKQLKINKDWYFLRSISDQLYDQKLESCKDIARSIGLNYERPIGCSPNRGATKLVIERLLQSPFEVSSYPLDWHDQNTESDIEAHFRIARNIILSKSNEVA